MSEFSIGRNQYQNTEDVNFLTESSPAPVCPSACTVCNNSSSLTHITQEI